MKYLELIGKEFNTTHSGKCVIINVVNKKKIIVEFEDGYQTVCSLANLKAGVAYNPFHPKLYGKGFMGVGEYRAKIGKSIHPYYDAWRGALRRCYDPKWHEKWPRYTNCTVEKQWNNYQVFCEWSEKQVFEVGYKLDKDLLVAGNKVYGPDTCVYLPNELNCIIADQWKMDRGLPKGVSISAHPRARNKKFVASLQRKNTKNFNLGYFETPEEASEVYKREKEKYVKERAEFWKDRISKRAYEGLINWVLPE